MCGSHPSPTGLEDAVARARDAPQAPSLDYFDVSPTNHRVPGSASLFDVDHEHEDSVRLSMDSLHS